MFQKKIRRIPFLSRMQIKNQIYFVFCLTVVFPVMLLGFFTIRHTAEILYDRAYQQLESDNTRAKSVLFDVTLNFYSISDDIIADSTLKSILQKDYASAAEARSARESYGRLATTLSNNASISSICVYTENDMFPVEGQIQSANSEQVKDWFQQVRIPGSVYWETSVSEQSGTG